MPGGYYSRVKILGHKLLHAPFAGSEAFHASLDACVDEVLLHSDSFILVAMGSDEG